jgi:hypothetical protein
MKQSSGLSSDDRYSSRRSSAKSMLMVKRLHMLETTWAVDSLYSDPELLCCGIYVEKTKSGYLCCKDQARGGPPEHSLSTLYYGSASGSDVFSIV